MNLYIIFQSSPANLQFQLLFSRGSNDFREKKRVKLNSPNPSSPLTSLKQSLQSFQSSELRACDLGGLWIFQHPPKR